MSTDNRTAIRQEGNHRVKRVFQNQSPVTMLFLVAALVLSTLALPRAALGQTGNEAEPEATPTVQEEDADETEVGNAQSEVAQALPPADLPTGNLLGLEFQLESTLAVDFNTAPTDATVYLLRPSEFTADDASELADTLGLTGEVEDRGGGTFVVSGDGDLFVTPLLIQYLSPATPTLGDLPSNTEAVDQAREWLRRTGLAPADLGEGRVTTRAQQVGRVVVVFNPLEPDPILAAYPTIAVTLGPDGEVLEASIRWAEISVADRYVLRPAEEAWRQVESGQAYLEANVAALDLEPGTVLEGTANYTRIGIAYTTAGPPGGDQFLTPVYVFSGRMTLTGDVTGDFPISAYVAAIATSDTPVG